ncbi:MAG TPA: PmoA family protein [Methylomirabilota bacterium]|nr:PmoA family protein [Methylomirabilota bacterium]
MSITIQLGPCISPRANFVAEVALPGGSLVDGAWEMLDTESGEALPAQLDAVEGAPRASWYVKELAPGEKRGFELRPAAQPASASGIDLHPQDENGRIVVYYGGLLQTIYHYGHPNYRPRFAPNVAPCGRPGSAVGSTDGSQPKSITDDGPPDHTWHRSLWYACGDLNGVDFYLEPAAMQSGYGPHVGTGYGRIVHRSFDWLVSGPVWGGFRQRVQWVAPDGAVLLDDLRGFRMYRLKGRLRLWDIEAAFTPHDAAVTFGQTNENALPLMRVADIIDEWDGGTMSLSTGATGSPACFGQRAQWADCSGPFTRAPGHEPEVYGIAMLDHPSNRNHPNAWFVRGYGPIGANLPFFDGPLTLAPGETWTLRHRMYIHQGYAAEGGVAARFDEYADPVPASVL